MTPLFKVFVAPEAELMPPLREVLYGGQIAEGEPVYRFEREFSAWSGHPTVAALSSGTAALHLALKSAGVRPGDEVISTPMTAEPTNIAIYQTGAKIVWADVDPSSGNICPSSVRALLNGKTRAIMVVHYAGVPARMSEISRLAHEAGIPVIEDAAHALGARYARGPIGAMSDFAIYSFQAIKHMTTVDGGMLVLKREEDLPGVRRLRWFGMERGRPRQEIDITEAGYKYNMNNVTATIGSIQLRHADWIIARHIENGRFFDRTLRGVTGLDLVRWDAEAEPSYWLYTILVERRDDLSRKLAEAGVQSSQVHKRNDRHSIFSGSRRPLPGLDKFYGRMLHIPCGWWVTDTDRENIVQTIRSGW
jgi:perosamine synthetase